MDALVEIEAEMVERAASIGAHRDDLPTLVVSDHSGRQHLEHDARGYHVVVCERGSEHARKTTTERHTLLYWVFEAVTSELAFAYELAHRVKGQDSRRVAFARQVELLGRLSPQWAQKRTRELEALLREYPYDDATG